MINKKVMYNFFINYTDLFKKSIFIKNHSTRDIQSQITLKKSRARYARAFRTAAFINKDIDLGISKARKYNKQTQQNYRLQK